MGNIVRNKEAVGFLILTSLLALTFTVSILYADSKGGVIDNVSWYVEVSAPVYNSFLETTTSSHYVYLFNNTNAPIYYTYEFKHGIDGWALSTTDMHSGWLGAGELLSRSNTLVVDVSSIPPSNPPSKYTARAYSRVQFGPNPDNQNFPPKAEETADFYR